MSEPTGFLVSISFKSFNISCGVVKHKKENADLTNFV